MSQPARFAHYTYEDYRRFEEATDAKHEYLDGQILAMAGGTPEHAALATALIGLLERGLAGGPCYPFSSDLRVRVHATGLATYPDVTVICGDLDRDPEDPNAAANPTLLAEVSSASTEEYDRGEKFAHYRKIGSLREYLIVSHRERRVERWWRRGPDDWGRESAGRGEVLRLSALGIDLDVDAVYERSPLTRTI
ncbi:Uma2 family endonuclease [Candidatus Binatia bacterium]|nr:Uma2 family endonuclease [Candidatus Binatia bacterium]